jgi:hypothetical protein
VVKIIQIESYDSDDFMDSLVEELTKGLKKNYTAVKRLIVPKKSG